MTSITVQSPSKVAAPRAAGVAASLFAGLVAWFNGRSQARAERAAQADRAQEATAVRQYAQRFASHDPRFAADLLAAADRHERT
jgi:hypothetical protein